MLGDEVAREKALTSELQTTKPAAILRLLHYPNQPPVSKKNGEMGIGRHTE